MSSEIIPVNQEIELRAVEERYTTDLHNLVIKNKTWLQTAFELGAACRQRRGHAPQRAEQPDVAPARLRQNVPDFS